MSGAENRERARMSGVYCCIIHITNMRTVKLAIHYKHEEHEECEVAIQFEFKALGQKGIG